MIIEQILEYFVVIVNIMNFQAAMIVSILMVLSVFNKTSLWDHNDSI